MAKHGISKRELIDTGGNKMFGKRDAGGRFREMDDVGRSQAADRWRAAKTVVNLDMVTRVIVPEAARTSGGNARRSCRWDTRLKSIAAWIAVKADAAVEDDLIVAGRGGRRAWPSRRSARRFDGGGPGVRGRGSFHEGRSREPTVGSHRADVWPYHPGQELSMSISRRQALASLLGAGAGGAAVAGQIVAAGQSTEPRVLSGSDLGFRVDGIAKDGAPIGAIVVRVDGKWVSPQFQSGIRRIT